MQVLGDFVSPALRVLLFFFLLLGVSRLGVASAPASASASAPGRRVIWSGTHASSETSLEERPGREAWQNKIREKQGSAMDDNKRRIWAHRYRGTISVLAAVM